MTCSEFCKKNSHSLCNGMSFMLITGPSVQQEKNPTTWAQSALFITFLLLSHKVI